MTVDNLIECLLEGFRLSGYVVGIERGGIIQMPDKRIERHLYVRKNQILRFHGPLHVQRQMTAQEQTVLEGACCRFCLERTEIDALESISFDMFLALQQLESFFGCVDFNVFHTSILQLQSLW